MDNKNYLKDISDIKTMMSRSSRFMSLSGLSGVLAGVYALIGAILAYFELKRYDSAIYTDTEIVSDNLDTTVFLNLVSIALFVLISAIVTGAILTMRKAKKQNEKIWNPVSKRLLVNFGLPLVTGGLFCIVLIQHGILGLVAPATLIFYGLSLVNASKFTIGDIKYLGIAYVIIGLIATQFVGYGLYFWALGFGVFHIIYGTILYNKYDR
ncbi:hypothetical protein DSM03_104103 [Leeuwenhoekiella aestuarii]|uniref:Uncharacterized protein n=1 Tax=Leeuwenhoekiella aestuarii TaxID=2249426 RepID=A0A4Q0NRJ1_9FLAO|nr:hypothetical protein [Leeuwenhoekiella aestuarii]RXG13323.1 hypothetical protein DSM04_105302 [Leeuwenhoekiella aestuarii]RXG14946.1 hypothetical protein DSM03_104103 [Leeuwenhoekiella aestuarii]